MRAALAAAEESLAPPMSTLSPLPPPMPPAIVSAGIGTPSFNHTGDDLATAGSLAAGLLSELAGDGNSRPTRNVGVIGGSATRVELPSTASSSAAAQPPTPTSQLAPGPAVLGTSGSVMVSGLPSAGLPAVGGSALWGSFCVPAMPGALGEGERKDPRFHQTWSIW